MRTKQAGQRTRVGYFAQHKFGPVEVRRRLSEYGFKGKNYQKVIVAWDWTLDAKRAAKRRGIELWAMRDLLRELGEQSGRTRSRSADDTARTLQLYHRGLKTKKEVRGSEI